MRLAIPPAAARRFPVARRRRRATGNRRAAAGGIASRIRKGRGISDLLQPEADGGGKENRVAGQRQGRESTVQGVGCSDAPRAAGREGLTSLNQGRRILRKNASRAFRDGR